MKNRARKIATGVFPVPPTVRFPTETTFIGRLWLGGTPSLYESSLERTPAAERTERAPRSVPVSPSASPLIRASILLEKDTPTSSRAFQGHPRCVQTRPCSLRRRPWQGPLSSFS